MNLLQAKIVLRCRPSKRLEDIWKTFQGKYRYDYICRNCSLMAKLGYLVKRKWKSQIHKRVVVYYTATKRGLDEAVEVMNLRFEEKMRSATTIPIDKYVSTLRKA